MVEFAGAFCSSSLMTRNEPDIPRCISSTSPEARSASRYLARRAETGHGLALEPPDKILLEGKSQVFSPDFRSYNFRSLHDRLQARRTVSTSGNSGMDGAFTLRC